MRPLVSDLSFLFGILTPEHLSVLLFIHTPVTGSGLELRV